MKIAMLCDSLYGKGGQTRVQIELANFLNADIITSGFDPNIRKWMKINNKVIDIGNLTYKYNIALSYYFEAPLRFLFYKNSDYDLYIYNGTSSIFSTQKNGKNIWLCYTPNRLLYDLKTWKLNTSSIFKSILFRVHIFLFKSLDQKAVNNFSDIVAISKTVNSRIKKYYNKNSTVIYPPVDSKSFKFNKFGDYFLAVSRLTPEKRMDLIVNAFKEMPNKKLILVGDGVQKKEILKQIKDVKNITLITNSSDQDLIELYSNCLAVVYMPKDEDYGLVPLESMASGKMCIAVNEGGCRETVINKRTGYLIPPTKKALVDTVNKISKTQLEKMKEQCIMQARKFNSDISSRQWREIVAKYSS